MAPPSDFTSAELKTLRLVAGRMIPPSVEFGVPGADDPVIFADIVRSIDRDGPALKAALAALKEKADGSPAVEQIDRIPLDMPVHARTFEAVITRCYYRDVRVLTSIGMEPRPPFPRGYDVSQGDWSLLEPVRARGPIWRAVD